jgi:hypothetical protein
VFGMEAEKHIRTVFTFMYHMMIVVSKGFGGIIKVVVLTHFGMEIQNLDFIFISQLSHNYIGTVAILQLFELHLP